MYAQTHGYGSEEILKREKISCHFRTERADVSFLLANIRAQFDTILKIAYRQALPLPFWTYRGFQIDSLIKKLKRNSTMDQQSQSM